ncbi:MAG: hypothetical protein GY778_11235 [bacterium]|nr:hypothetical protein [bacterium]
MGHWPGAVLGHLWVPVLVVGLQPSAAWALPPVNEPVFALTPGSGTILNGAAQGTDDLLDPTPAGAEDVGGPGPQVHVPAGWISSFGIGFQVDALSSDHAALLQPVPVRFCFSVDTNATGAAGAAVADEAAVGQAAGDLFVTSERFNLFNPAPIPGPAGNVLAVNQTVMTLAPTAGPGVGPAGWPNPGFLIDDVSAYDPYAFDIVGDDQWQELPLWWSFVAGSGAGIPDPTPPERRPTGADLMLSPGPPGLAYYAKANLMGLDLNNDDLDAVIVFEMFSDGLATPGVDVAIFSVPPGSALDPVGGNVYWTSFMGNNFLIADNASLGLGPNDNLDALAVYVGQLQGDADNDGDIDLDDYDAFDVCAVNGPDAAYPVGAGCDEFDFDGDGDVDLEDFAELQELFTGP